MAILTPQFSANRTVREYTEKYYLPAAANYIKRAADKGAAGIRIIHTRQELGTHWEGIKLGEVQKEAIKDGYSFCIAIALNSINPAAIVVELYAEGIHGEAIEKIKMQTESANNVEDKNI